MIGQKLIELIFTWGLMGLYMSLAIGLVFFLGCVALIGGLFSAFCGSSTGGGF